MSGEWLIERIKKSEDEGRQDRCRHCTKLRDRMGIVCEDTGAERCVGEVHGYELVEGHCEGSWWGH